MDVIAVVEAAIKQCGVPEDFAAIMGGGSTRLCGATGPMNNLA